MDPLDIFSHVFELALLIYGVALLLTPLVFILILIVLAIVWSDR